MTLWNFLARFAPSYFSDRYQTDWGAALNFDGEGSGPVRSYVLGNAAYWIEEFHLDGLRIDAAQSLFDTSDEHIIAAIARRSARRPAGGGRWSSARTSRSESGSSGRSRRAGSASTPSGADDFHHAARVAATGRREGYYGDYRGTAAGVRLRLPRRLPLAGAVGRPAGKRRGDVDRRDRPRPRSSSTSRTTTRSPTRPGASGSTSSRAPAEYRAADARSCCSGSGTPLLFQGQEFASSSPFLYFGDLDPEVAEQMHRGRREFLKQFPTLATPEMQARVPHPTTRATFARSKLDQSERGARTPRHTPCIEDLLRLRRDDATLRGGAGRRVDGAILGPEAFVLRFFDGAGGATTACCWSTSAPTCTSTRAAEPLLAPPEGRPGGCSGRARTRDTAGGGVPRMGLRGEWRRLADPRGVSAPVAGSTRPAREPEPR